MLTLADRRRRRPSISPSRRATRIGSFAVAAAALVATSLFVTTSSYSVFSATTANPGNSWSTGSVTLTDDAAGNAMFTATGLASGSTGSRCIAVTSTGTMPSVVKLYGTSYSTTNSLGSNIDLVITQGTGGTSSSCSGFTALPSGSAVYSGTLNTFGTTKTAYGSGTPTTGAWAPTGSGSETRVFKIDYTVGASAPQNSTASVTFTWEAQSS